jgi:hypothetical protein
MPTRQGASGEFTDPHGDDAEVGNKMKHADVTYEKWVAASTCRALYGHAPYRGVEFPEGHVRVIKGSVFSASHVVMSRRD